MVEVGGLREGGGRVAQPKISRGTRDGIVLAVNGRPITSRPLAYALEDCYQGRLERGRHPIAAIDIGIDAALVDINVHPAKREVRFREEGAVFAALQRAVRAALGASEPIHYRAQQAAGMAASREYAPELVVHGAAVLQLEEGSPSPSSVGVLRPIGQVGAGYLVAEGPQGLVLVDEHAGHERLP